MTNSERTGSWISTICQGRPVRRSLAAPSITPSSDATLCGSFVPAAVAGVVDVREVVFEVDARADREDGLEDPRQDRALGVVLGRVVGGEERPAVEEQAAGPLAPADDADGVGRVAQLRPGLRQVLRPLLDVLRGPPANDSVSGADMNRRQRSWALRSQVASMAVAGRLELVAVRLGEAVEVEEGDRVVAGVVVAADEDRLGRDGQAPRGPAARGPAGR